MDKIQSFILMLEQIVDIVATALKGYSHVKINELSLSMMNNACVATGVLTCGIHFISA
jgi:hypothetical protein